MNASWRRSLWLATLATLATFVGDVGDVGDVWRRSAHESLQETFNTAPTGEEVWRRGGLENLWEMQRFGYMAVVSAFGRPLVGVLQASYRRVKHIHRHYMPPPPQRPL